LSISKRRISRNKNILNYCKYINLTCIFINSLVKSKLVIKMKTTLTKRGQTSVPSEIIKKYNLKKGSKLYWLDTGKGIKIIPIPNNIIEITHGIAKGEDLLKLLLESRKKDKLSEN